MNTNILQETYVSSNTRRQDTSKTAMDRVCVWPSSRSSHYDDGQGTVTGSQQGHSAQLHTTGDCALHNIVWYMMHTVDRRLVYCPDCKCTTVGTPRRALHKTRAFVDRRVLYLPSLCTVYTMDYKCCVSMVHLYLPVRYCS